MKKSSKVLILLCSIFIFFSSISINLAQENYYTVSDIDSFAYATTDASLLILKRDSLNYLQYHKSIPIPAYNYVYSIIKDPYLIICSSDTLYLYSIADREIPLLKNRMFLGDILRLEDFGPYIVAVRRNILLHDVISVKADTIKIINSVERVCYAHFPFNTCHRLSFSYPYVFSLQDSSLEMIKYDSLQNTFNTLFYADYRWSSYSRYYQIISNSTNLYLLEGEHNPPYGFYCHINKYIIIPDTLNSTSGGSGCFIPVIEIWEANDRFIAHIKDIKDSRADNYNSYHTNINFWNSGEEFILTETNAYHPGSALHYSQKITNDSIIFKRYIYTPNTIEIDPMPTKPISYALRQNYPNPFNPTTTIKYLIPELSFVTIIVYDVLGNEVATLVNEELHAGEYEVEFSAKGGTAFGGNALNLPSGIYFYQLRASSFIQTKKMVFMK